jgi:pyruvate/2-oxoglutarate dehydrogenase complex dihydrolipoamide dehydrogenase (E3) component
MKKTQPEEFDLVILGGGTGSTIAAWTFAGEGTRVAVVERKYIGGSCPNIACLPSKNIVHSLNDMYMENYRNTGAEFILGTGRFLAPGTVEVTLADGTTRQLRGANVIVSTGTRAALETIPGLAEAQPLTRIEALELRQNSRITSHYEVPPEESRLSDCGQFRPLGQSKASHLAG